MSQTTATEGKRLRIAVFNRTFAATGGGAERYAIALVEQLAARHEVHVFAQQIAHDWPGVTYHRVSMPLRKPRWVNQLWYATATWWATRPGQGFDIVHSHENTWHGNVQTVHVLPVWHNLFHGRHGFKRLLRWVKVVTSPRLLTYLGLESLRFTVPPAPAGLASGRFIMVTSDSLHQTMAATFPQAAPALHVLVPGVELPAGVTTGEQRTLARTALGLPQDRCCILLVGNDFRKKGLESLILALSLLPASVCVAVVGSLQQMPGFKVQVESLGLAGRVFFLGQLEDVGPAYQAADILAHPTLEDTFAMVVLEAMAHGLPVVVSGPEYCGIAGLLHDGQDALLLADPRDAKALATHLQRLLNDAAFAESLGLAARKFAAGHAWPEKARQQDALYRQLVANAREG